MLKSFLNWPSTISLCIIAYAPIEANFTELAVFFSLSRPRIALGTISISCMAYGVPLFFTLPGINYVTLSNYVIVYVWMP